MLDIDHQLRALGFDDRAIEQYRRPVPGWRNPLFGAHLRAGCAYWDGQQWRTRPAHPYAYRKAWHGRRPNRPRRRRKH